ncbi:MAG: phosphatidate cytidylyltransferase [Solirubrobacterales bacterium]
MRPPREADEPRRPRDEPRGRAGSRGGGDGTVAPEVPDFVASRERGGRGETGGVRKVEGEGGRGGGGGGRKGLSETASRLLWALPAIALAIFVIVMGGWVFAATMLIFGLIGLAELFAMSSDARPIQPVAYLAVAAMVVAAQLGDSFQIVLVGVALFPVMLVFAAQRRSLRGITSSFAVTVFAVIWIGLPFAHAVLLRNLDHGAGLVIDVVVATFIVDTFAYFGGRAVGEHALAPTISPNKTIEGFAIGVAAGTLAFWVAGLYQDWLSGTDALLMGVLIALVAPIGDLFESAIKRDLDAEDSGNLFGPHGGLLDRLDGALFTIVAGYYLSLAIVL